MTKPAEPVCNCIAQRGYPYTHTQQCAVYEQPLTYSEIRQLRGLLKYLYPQAKPEAKS